MNNMLNKIYFSLSSTPFVSLLLIPFYFVRFIIYAFIERSLFFCRYYPGYHGSTIPSLRYIKANEARIFVDKKTIDDGIDLNDQKQIHLLKRFSKYYPEFLPPAKETGGKLYHYDNDMFGFNDGFILYAFIRHFHPNQIIEAGSGYSSAVMLETCSEFSQQTALTFIDPYSKTISDVLNKNATQLKVNLIRQEIQDIDTAYFRKLQANDILFIDTSHVLKVGSDLSTLLFSVIPVLNSGVIIHIHDIWYSWEYPREFLYAGRAYNEMYFVRSFLQYNHAFEIMFFSSFMERREKLFIRENMPRYSAHTGNSLWLRKTS